MRTRVVLADDHKLFTEALCTFLATSCDVVGVASNGRELIDLATQLNPDLIVLDIAMPLLNGLEALRALRRANIRSKFAILTMYADVSLAAEAFRAGASAFVLKQSTGQELNAAIASVIHGRMYLSSSFPVDLLTLLAEAVRKPPDEYPRITRRQREVLQLVAEGKTMKEIGVLLHLSTRTVESYKYEIMQVLGMRTNAELVQYAIRIGAISVAPMEAG